MTIDINIPKVIIQAILENKVYTLSIRNSQIDQPESQRSIYTFHRDKDKTLFRSYYQDY